MRTYVAEINGEALIVFRAEGDNEAHDIVNEKNANLQLGLNGFSECYAQTATRYGWGSGNQGKAGDRR
jgi:hypothetical protein